MGAAPARALLLCAAMPGSSAWRAPYRHSWVGGLAGQSFDFGNNPVRFDNRTELERKARYSVVFLDAGTGAGAQVGYGLSCCNSSLPGGGPQCAPECDYFSVVERQAAALRAAAPGTAIYIYTSAFCTSAQFGHPAAATIDDPAHAGWWLDCVDTAYGACPPSRGSARLWDFRNASARAGFAAAWGARAAASPVLDGVYADSGDMGGCDPRPSLGGHVFTQAEKEAIFNGTVLAWRAATAALNAAGKHFTVSLKTMFDDVPASPAWPPEGSACAGGLQRGRTHGAEDIIFDLMAGTEWLPFRQYNIPSKDFGKDAAGCAAAVENVAREVGRAGEQPVFVCCNDANRTRDGGAGLNASLAAYLMNANDNTFFGAGSHWANEGWDPVFAEFPQLTRDLGAPQTRSFRRDGFVFRRSFGRVDVALDCHPVPGCAAHGAAASCAADPSGGCAWMTRGGGGACVDLPVGSFDWR